MLQAAPLKGMSLRRSGKSLGSSGLDVNEEVDFVDNLTLCSEDFFINFGGFSEEISKVYLFGEFLFFFCRK